MPITNIKLAMLCYLRTVAKGSYYALFDQYMKG